MEEAALRPHDRCEDATATLTWLSYALSQLVEHGAALSTAADAARGHFSESDITTPHSYTDTSVSHPSPAVPRSVSVDALRLQVEQLLHTAARLTFTAAPRMEEPVRAAVSAEFEKGLELAVHLQQLGVLTSYALRAIAAEYAGENNSNGTRGATASASSHRRLPAWPRQLPDPPQSLRDAAPEALLAMIEAKTGETALSVSAHLGALFEAIAAAHAVCEGVVEVDGADEVGREDRLEMLSVILQELDYDRLKVWQLDG
jgi:hypothetical protein